MRCSSKIIELRKFLEALSLLHKYMFFYLFILFHILFYNSLANVSIRTVECERNHWEKPLISFHTIMVHRPSSTLFHLFSPSSPTTNNNQHTMDFPGEIFSMLTRSSLSCLALVLFFLYSMPCPNPQLALLVFSFLGGNEKKIGVQKWWTLESEERDCEYANENAEIGMRNKSEKKSSSSSPSQYFGFCTRCSL